MCWGDTARGSVWGTDTGGSPSCHLPDGPEEPPATLGGGISVVS